jgi:acetolactate synthase-1/2/3 large subunit
MAAEAYARVDNRIAAVCVTTGPGGTNALTGVVGGWMDSVPMLILSGQVRYDTTARCMQQFVEGGQLRAVGDQEFDITRCAASMCKYAVMVEKPMQIRYCLEKALFLAMDGRKGPSWVDIPVNYQGMTIETEELLPFEPHEEGFSDDSLLPDTNLVSRAIERLAGAKRPVLYAGNGIRLSGGYEQFRQMVERLGIPVVTCWDSIDAIEDSHSLYVGRGGIMGDRAGNFAVQNADVILAIGNRLSIRQVGYNWKTWAREAYVIMVDVDPAELQKTTLHVELPIHADAGAFCAEMNRQLEERQPNETHLSGTQGKRHVPQPLDGAIRPRPLADCGEWVRQCHEWKINYPVTLPRHWEEDGTYANVYAFIRYLSDSLPDGNRTVVSDGSACVVGSHNYVIKKDARFLINSGIASMGYGLPAAVGTCIASGKQPVICIEGDGSLMMNLQELQTVITNRLPIRMFVINNAGYHSIRQTQNNMFAGRDKVGIGPESGDLSFPKFALVARAFGWEYMSASSNAEMKQMVDRALQTEGPVFCEVFVSPAQNFEPKSSTKRLADGTLISPPLEDLAPFLPREELLRNMYIDMPE